jgi:peptide/nickel transport system permease protein
MRLAGRTRGLISANRNITIGLVLLGLVIVGAILVNLLSPYDPIAQSIAERLRGPSASHPLGTDSLGRDVLTRMGAGAGLSMLISILAVVVGGFAGSVIGLVSGVAPPSTDRAIMATVNVLLALPALLLAMLIATLLGAGSLSVIIAIASANIAIFARLVRGEAQRVQHELFIEAARSTGARLSRIVLRHIVPHLTSVLLVALTLRFSTALLTEAVLSYLGLGVPPPQPTLGNMILEGQRNLEFALWISLGPGAAIMLAVLGANLIGDGLRDLLDPRLRGSLRHEGST